MLIQKYNTLLLIILVALVNTTVEIPDNGGGFFYATLEKGSLSGIPDGNYYVNVNISDARQQFKLSLDPYSYSLSVMKAEKTAEIASSYIDVTNRYNSTESQTHLSYSANPNSYYEKNYLFPYHIHNSTRMTSGTLICDVALDNIKMQLTHYNRQTGLNFIPFIEISKIEDSTQSFKLYDGFVGLEPYQNSISKDISLPQSVNFMRAMRDAHIITNEIFMVQTDQDTNVVKFGGYDKGSISNDLVVLECSDSSSFKLDLTKTLINGVDAFKDEATKIRKVRLDVSQPYLYLPSDDYTKIINGINAASVMPNLNCDRDLNVCRWGKGQSCSKITAEAATTTISIIVQDHTTSTKTVTIETKVNDLLLDGSNFGQKAGEYCYLPIFSSKIESTNPDKDEWYIGNLFLRDKVLVFDNAYQRDQDLSPQIGFGVKAQDGTLALQHLYDVTNVDYKEYVYHQANDSSVPTGYFNGVDIPQPFDLRGLFDPDTNCTAEEAKTQCIPNPIVIPNPYPYPIAPAVVEIPNEGGFFYASLESGKISGISDGAQYVNVNISDNQNNFKLTVNPYVYGLSVMNSKSSIDVPLKYNSVESQTQQLINKNQEQQGFVYQYAKIFDNSHQTSQLTESNIDYMSYYESFKMKLNGYGRQTGLDFLPFMNIDQLSNLSDIEYKYKSNYDGYIGLAPSQSKSSQIIEAPSVNLMKALKENNIIANEVTMVQIGKQESVIKFGGYDQSAISGFLTILQCHEQNNYWLETTQMMIDGVNALASSTGQLSIRVVRIDISQPYLYLPIDDYTRVVNSLNSRGVMPTLNCDSNYNFCRWNQNCSTIQHLEGHTFSIIVQDHTDPSKTVNLESNVTELLLDGSNFGQIPGKYCYLPIFASKLATQTLGGSIDNQWFIGNLFVRDKVLVFDNAYSRNQNLNPQIGFGTKAKVENVALQTLYDVNYSKYSEFGNNKQYDQSVPTGYFNSVVLPEALDLREIGPDTTCTTEEAKTQCVPNPIIIPNPYPYPVRPPSPPPKPIKPITPNPTGPQGSSSGVIIGVAIGVSILIIAGAAVGYTKCKKRGGPSNITPGQRIPIMDENNTNMSYSNNDISQSDMDGPMKKAIQ